MDDNYNNDSPLSSLSGSPEKNIRNRTFEYLNRSRFSSPTDRYLRYIGFDRETAEIADISIDSRDDSYLMDVYPFEIENNEERRNVFIDTDDQSQSLIDGNNSIHSLSTLFWENIILYMDERRSIFTYSFLVLNLSFFIYGLIKNGGKFLKTCPDEDILFYDGISNWPICEDQRIQLWRFFTSTLVHSDIGHLFINLIILIPYSLSLETVQKSMSLLLIYILTTVHSSMIFFIQNPYISVIGCSNIVFSFIGAHLSNFILNYDFHSIEFDTYYVTIIPSILILLLEILGYIYRRSENVAYIGHWSGFISGLLGGLVFFKIFIKRRYKNVIKLFGILLYLIMTLTLLYYYIKDYPPIISYDEFFNKKETIDCCYEWFTYKNKHNLNNDYFDNFTCPYKVEYTNTINLLI